MTMKCSLNEFSMLETFTSYWLFKLKLNLIIMKPSKAYLTVITSQAKVFITGIYQYKVAWRMSDTQQRKGLNIQPVLRFLIRKSTAQPWSTCIALKHQHITQPHVSVSDTCWTWQDKARNVSPKKFKKKKGPWHALDALWTRKSHSTKARWLVSPSSGNIHHLPSCRNLPWLSLSLRFLVDAGWRMIEWV